MIGCRYEGDLSRADRQVLAEMAMTHRRLLEFGAGASTQVLALRGDQAATFWCVETDLRWVQTTRDNLRRLNARLPHWLTWEDWQASEPAEFDLVFNDGRDDLRMDFALRAWPMLGEGGVMIWHDALQPHVGKRIAAMWERFYQEIASIEIGIAGSNMAVVKKRVAVYAQNWNENERLNAGHVATNPTHLGMSKDELLDLRASMEAIK